MPQFNMLEAKTKLSKLVEAVENGSEQEIVLARNGKPVARIVALAPKSKERRPLGLHNGEYGDISLEAFNAMDEEIARLMIDGPLFPDEEPVEAPRRKKIK